LKVVVKHNHRRQRLLHAQKTEQQSLVALHRKVNPVLQDLILAHSLYGISTNPMLGLAQKNAHAAKKVWLTAPRRMRLDLIPTDAVLKH
jgi:hypothetical protein